MFNSYELLLNVLGITIQADIPVHVQGDPGIGKTKIIEMLARVLNAELAVLIGSISDPTDFGGLPMSTEDGVRMLPREWARRLNDLPDGKSLGIVFADELTTVPPMVQAAMLRVFCERQVGDLMLKPHVRMVAASNPPEIAASGQNIAPPLANRFCHVTFNIDSNIWCDGVVSGFPDIRVPTLPYDWKDRIGHFRVLIAGFIKSAGREKLISVPKHASQQSGPWPSPRTWDMSARALAAAESVGFSGHTDQSRQVRNELLSGLVGHGVAMEFLEWEQKADLPDPEEVLADPRKFKLPRESDRAYAAANAIMAAVLAKPTKARWEAGMLALALGARGRADVVTRPARILTTAENRPEGATLPDEFDEMHEMFKEAGLIPRRPGGAKPTAKKK